MTDQMYAIDQAVRTHRVGAKGNEFTVELHPDIASGFEHTICRPESVSI
jgi:hypothetical protein